MVLTLSMSRTGIHAALAAFVVLATSSAALDAQRLATSDSVAILAAAVQAADARAPRARVAFGFADSLHVSHTVGEVVGRRVSTAFSSLDSARVCAGGKRSPGGCHLVGVDVFIDVTGISSSGDTARVFLTIADETKSTRQPIHYAWIEVVVGRSGIEWKVVRLRGLAES